MSAAFSGSVRELRPGYWQLRVYVGRDPITHKDRTRTKAVRATSKREAAKHLPKFIVSLSAETVATNGTVGHLLDETIRHLRSRGREATTLRGYEGCAKQIKAAFGDVPLTALTPQTINAYYDKLTAGGAKPGTVGNHHRFLRRAFSLAVRWGWATDNVVKRADPPTARTREIVPPSNGTVGKLVAAAADVDKTLGLAVMLAAALGCRRGELCGLRWSDIDLDSGEVRIERAVKQLTRAGVADLGALPDGYEVVGRALLVGDVKTHAARRLTVGPSVLVMLNGHHNAMRARAKDFRTVLRADGYVLSDDVAGSVPWRPDRLTKAVEALRVDVGAPTLRLHDLRHWNATELLTAEDVTTVAARLGHGDKSTTHRVYAHMKPSADGHAATIIDAALFGNSRTPKVRKRRKA